jgi:hypothetical protein
VRDGQQFTAQRRSEESKNATQALVQMKKSDP